MGCAGAGCTGGVEGPWRLHGLCWGRLHWWGGGPQVERGTAPQCSKLQCRKDLGPLAGRCGERSTGSLSLRAMVLVSCQCWNQLQPWPSLQSSEVSSGEPQG